MVSIIDYGMGNLRSVRNALNYLGVQNRLSQDPAELLASDHLLLPGVGAFSEAMKNLHRLGLVAPIREAAARGIPVLGICLGMQLLADEGDEGGPSRGLGLIPGTVKRLSDQNGQLKIPHMGFNQVQFTQPHPVFEGVASGSDFYFAHSYQLDCADEHTAGLTTYGGPVRAIVFHRNVYGFQFHPEKSQSHGLALLANFCGVPGC